MKDLGVKSANTVWKDWTAALNRRQDAWVLLISKNILSRVYNDGYIILQYLSEYEPDFENNEVRSKRPAS